MRSSVSGLVLIGLVVFTAPPAAGQELSPAARLGTGLAIEYGLGSCAVTDEYFSAEKYTGTLPWLRVQWRRAHERAVYQLALEARTSSRIRNYSIATRLTQVSLVQGFLYPLPQKTLLGRDLALFLGPCTEIFLLVNTQDLAASALGFGLSTSVLLSLGIRAEFILPLSSKLSVEGAARAGVLSLGVRAVDEEMNDDAANPKLLTALAGTHAVLRLGLGYRLSGAFTARLAYQFSLTRLTPWTPLLAASDTVLTGLTWSF